MENDEIARMVAEYNNLWKEQNEIYSAAAKSYGLSDSAMWILYFLRLNGGSCMQRDINSQMAQPKQTINSAIKQLERSGYVSLSSGEDRRCRMVELTPSGEELAVRTSDHVISAERNVWEDFSGADREQFICLIKKYNQRLKLRMSEENGKK